MKSEETRYQGTLALQETKYEGRGIGIYKLATNKLSKGHYPIHMCCCISDGLFGANARRAKYSCLETEDFEVKITCISYINHKTRNSS